MNYLHSAIFFIVLLLFPNIFVNGIVLTSAMALSKPQICDSCKNLMESQFTPPPLYQFKLGITASKVTCRVGFDLVIKRSDNSPACVKPQTAQKLVERGWGVWSTQTVWFELKPDDCRNVPWIREWVKSDSVSILIQSMTNNTLATEYLNNHNITLLQMKSFVLEGMIMSIGSPSQICLTGTLFLLVPQNDTSKMIELGFKSIDEKEVQGSEILLPNIPNTEQTVWFEFYPINCQSTPWDQYESKQFPANTSAVSVHQPRSQIIKSYFKEEGITVLDVREWLLPNGLPTQCGKPASDNVYYFLVPQSDAQKMMGLGDKMVKEKEMCTIDNIHCVDQNHL